MWKNIALKRVQTSLIHTVLFVQFQNHIPYKCSTFKKTIFNLFFIFFVLSFSFGFTFLHPILVDTFLCHQTTMNSVSCGLLVVLVRCMVLAILFYFLVEVNHDL